MASQVVLTVSLCSTLGEDKETIDYFLLLKDIKLELKKKTYHDVDWS